MRKRDNSDIGSFLDLITAVNKAAAAGQLIRKELGEIGEPLEVVTDDRHPGFDLDRKEIRPLHQQQIDFVALAVPKKEKIAAFALVETVFEGFGNHHVFKQVPA